MQFIQPARCGVISSALLLALASMGCNGHAVGSNGASATTAREERGAPIGLGTELVAHNEWGASVPLRVDGMVPEPADPDGDVFLYELSVHDAARGWVRYCEPDPDGKTYAIPLQGTWDASRRHILNDEITFACTNGALAKCVRWGYKPWKSVNGVSLAPYHQACLRMTTADYCDKAQPHTRNGTPINIWDRLGIQKREILPGMVFEAAWSSRGAVYLKKPRYGEPLEELVAECPDRLRGHTQLDVPDLDEEAIIARWPEALIFTESLVRTERSAD